MLNENLILEIKEKILPYLDYIGSFSIKNNLNIHTSIGSRYAELYAFVELSRFDPLIGIERLRVSNKIERPRSADIILAKTLKKIEVKWSVYHYKDEFMKRTKKNIDLTW